MLVDDICYLLVAVFGGMKTIRNDRRVVSTLMNIAIKVFEYELLEATSTVSKIGYELDSILALEAECAFMRIHRLVFQSQSANISFTNELFAQIVRLLYSERVNYMEEVKRASSAMAPEDGRALWLGDVFNYEDLIVSDPPTAGTRADRLKKFVVEVLDKVILKNIDAQKRLS